MVPRGIQPKLHLSSLLLWASKDTLVVNILASVLQVIQLKEQHSQVMVFPQLPKLAMKINHQLNLDMGLAMEHLKLRNLLRIPRYMGSLCSHLVAPLEAMASLPLCSQDMRIVLEILQWLEGTLSKVTKHGLLQAKAHLGLPPFNKQVMAMCSLEHIQPHIPNITYLSLLL